MMGCYNKEEEKEVNSLMSASSKFGEFSDSQLVDWMRCNPGGAAKAFQFWRRSHPDGEVVYQDRVKVVYKDCVVEKEVEVEKVVIEEKENPLNKVMMVIAGCSLLLGAVVGSFSGTAKVITKEVAGPERVVTKTVEVAPSDYSSLQDIANNPTQTEAYLSLKSENRALYGILCNRTKDNYYCDRN